MPTALQNPCPEVLPPPPPEESPRECPDCGALIDPDQDGVCGCEVAETHADDEPDETPRRCQHCGCDLHEDGQCPEGCANPEQVGDPELEALPPVCAVCGSTDLTEDLACRECADTRPTAVTLTTEQLRDEILWAKLFAEKASTLPVLTGLLLEVCDGLMSITATDLQVAAKTFAECASKDHKPWRRIVAADKFAAYIKTILEPELVLEPGPKSLTIRHGVNCEATMPCPLPVETFPELPNDIKPTFAIAGLSKALAPIRATISPEESRFTLNGALLELKPGSDLMVSADGHRMTLFPVLSNTQNDIRCLIPTAAIQSLQKLKTDAIAVGMNDDFLLFVHDHRRIIARKLTGNFPDYERVLSDKPCSVPIASRSLEDRLKRLDIFADSRSHAMQLEITYGTLTVTTQAMEEGSARAALPVLVPNPKPFSIGLNLQYVLEFLKFCGPLVELRYEPTTPEVPHCKVSLEMFDPDTRARFVVMPMRI